MATLYICEYSDVLHGPGESSVGMEPGTDQTPITISTSSQSLAFKANTRLVRIHTDAICSIVFGANPTATTSNKRLPANQTEYFGVVPGMKLAVVTNT